MHISFCFLKARIIKVVFVELPENIEKGHRQHRERLHEDVEMCRRQRREGRQVGHRERLHEGAVQDGLPCESDIHRLQVRLAGLVAQTCGAVWSTHL